jgi:hypothetical protein
MFVEVHFESIVETVRSSFARLDPFHSNSILSSKVTTKNVFIVRVDVLWSNLLLVGRRKMISLLFGDFGRREIVIENDFGRQLKRILSDDRRTNVVSIRPKKTVTRWITLRTKIDIHLLLRRRRTNDDRTRWNDVIEVFFATEKN